MDNLKQLKIENDYKKVESRIGSLSNYQSLETLANNIRNRISVDADYKHFVRLADNAEHKSKVLLLLLPSLTYSLSSSSPTKKLPPI